MSPSITYTTKKCLQRSTGLKRQSALSWRISNPVAYTLNGGNRDGRVEKKRWEEEFTALEWKSWASIQGAPLVLKYTSPPD